MKIEATPSFLLEVGETKQNIPKNDLFDKMLDSVLGMNEAQGVSNGLMQDVLMGKSDDTHGALIALEKADLQMQLAVTTRDKMIQGYQSIINMQI